MMLMNRQRIELLLDLRVVFRCVRDCGARASHCVELGLELCLHIIVC